MSFADKGPHLLVLCGHAQECVVDAKVRVPFQSQTFPAFVRGLQAPNLICTPSTMTEFRR